MRVERETELAAAPEALYDLVMDPSRLGDWVSIHAGFREPPPARLVKGSKLVQRLKVARRKFTVHWTVSDARRPQRVVWDGHGPAGTRAQVEYRFEPAGEGTTRFVYVNEYELPGGPAGKLAGRAVARAAGREIDRSLERPRKLVES